MFALLMGVSGMKADAITSVNQIVSNKCYTVTTPSRGSWTMNTDENK